MIAVPIRRKLKIALRKIYGGPWYKKLVVWPCTFVLLLILGLGAVDCNFLYLFGRSPGFKDIENPVVSEASEVYSADSVQLGRFFSENRTPVEYNEISPVLIHTLIDTEDERFYHHHGVDFKGLFAAVKDMARGRARGASTITQQLAKNLFRVRTQYSTGLLGYIPGVKLLVMKAKEWIVAIKLEIIFNKEEILTMYLNTVDFGSNSFGIKTAARSYFGTTPDKLTHEQAAVLVGLLKATSSYNPRINPRNSLSRRNTVLDLVYAHGHLTVDGKVATRGQLDSIKALPIQLASRHTASSYDGLAPYFREQLVEYINDLCEQGLVPGYDGDNKLDLYADGLTIYTSLDSRMQAYAEQAVLKQMKVIQQRFDNHWGSTPPWQDRQHREIPHFIEDLAKRTTHYKYLKERFPDQPDSVEYYLNQPHPVQVFTYDGMQEKELSTMDSIRYMVRFMHCGFVAIEPDTRQVKAWVGDIDFKPWKYDKVTAMRQPGSTFKLFVYTEAMNQGLTPCDKRRDEYISMQVFDKKAGKEVTWTPTNANGSFSGDSVPLMSAFARSINSVAVRLGMEMGVSRIAETAHKMGIESPLDETPSLPLGSSDVNLLELANAYSTVANDGKYVRRQIVTRILDRNGKEIYNSPINEEQVIPYKSAFFMQQLLMGGLREPGGTSQSLNGYVGQYRDTDWGGKTGTSNNHSDAWFMGVSPNLVVGAWVGGEYRCIHFRTGALGQGSRTALPICGYFLESVLKDPAFEKYHAKFAKPKDADILSSMYNCQSYVPRAKVDTIRRDSIHVEEEIILDENGNPVERQLPEATVENGSTDQTANPKKEPKRPKEQVVNFEDL